MRWLLAGALLVAVAGGVGLAVAYFTFVRDLPDFATLADYRPALTTTVVDRKGRLIGEFYEFRRRLTPLSEVPEVVIQAFLAAEDDTFYQHSGIDYRSILRAAWANLRAGGETVQGASTITQQTVKQLLLSPERTYSRKIRELLLARRLEERFTKDEILYLYLNQIYFGSGAYGVGEAARTYFGKEIGDVTPGEAALLAGLPKAPGRNSPYRNPDAAEERRQYVLGRMRDEGFIDEATWRDAVEHPPVLAEPRNEAFEAAAYFTEEVRRELVDRLGFETVLHGGLRVETPLDLDLQRDAVAALRAGLVALDQRQGYRGPKRKVARAEIEATLSELGDENALVGDAPKPLAEREPGSLLQGVVLAVDDRGGSARVGFAPGVDGAVRFEDVKWAHAADPHLHGGQASSIGKVFAVGDVVPFQLAPPASDGGAPRLLLAQDPLVQGALLSFEIASGRVLALVGGYDFAESEFDRATQAERQPGSAFKPIVYGAAVTRGYTPATLLYDRPVVYEEASGLLWRPENYSRQFLGPVTMTEALARSLNNATIHLAKDLGLDVVIDFAHRLGISSTLEPNLALALGVEGVTLSELTGAYAVYANGGRRVHPILIDRVLDAEGNVLLEKVPLNGRRRDDAPAADAPPADAQGAAATDTEAAESDAGGGDAPADPDFVMPPTQAYLATSLLRSVVELPYGTGRSARVLQRTLGGKTGTTNDQGDAWFVGFSPDVATGVWVGFDEKRVLGRAETGGRAALPIWISFMREALADRPDRDFPVPDGIAFARIDPKTGLLASPTTENALFEAFVAGTEPKETSSSAAREGESERRLRLDF